MLDDKQQRNAEDSAKLERALSYKVLENIIQEAKSKKALYDKLIEQCTWLQDFESCTIPEVQAMVDDMAITIRKIYQEGI